MLSLSRAPTLRRSLRRPANTRHPLGGAAVLGGVLALGFLALNLSGVPVLGWLLLAGAVVVSLVDIMLLAAGRQSQGILERLLRPRSGDT